MSVGLLEQQIFNLEGIRIVIRASNRANAGSYPYQKAASADITIKDWLSERVLPLVPLDDIVVVAGGGVLPNPNMSLKWLRDSYNF